MTCSLHNTQVSDVLDRLYTDHEQRGAAGRGKASPQGAESSSVYERFLHAKDLYMPIDRPFGQLMYAMVRASQPRTVIEFGTSFGISTIYLAAALRDNGAGLLVTTEFIAEKAETAKQNLTEAGLAKYVEFRIGDAVQTLRDPLPGDVDLLFLDGEKSMYLDVVNLLEHRMSDRCLVVSDNTDHAGAKSYLDHVRDSGNGYVTASLLTAGGAKHSSGHEVSVRVS